MPVSAQLRFEPMMIASTMSTGGLFADAFGSEQPEEEQPEQEDPSAALRLICHPTVPWVVGGADEIMPIGAGTGSLFIGAARLILAQARTPTRTCHPGALQEIRELTCLQK